MSVVAISQTLGSLGDEIGQELARMLGYQLVDREIIARAAERYGTGVTDLQHVTEEKPGVWERFADTKRRYLLFVEAIVLELAVRDRVIFLGRGATVLLRDVPHVLRVRITAPEPTRIARVQHKEGLSAQAAAHLLARSDRERDARVKFLYRLDWNDPLLYDLVLNTEHLGPGDAARIILEALLSKRFKPTPESLQHLADLSLTAQAKALLRGPSASRFPSVAAAATNGRLHVSGTVNTDEERQAVVALLKAVPGIKDVLDDIVVAPRRAVSV